MIDNIITSFDLSFENGGFPLQTDPELRERLSKCETPEQEEKVYDDYFLHRIKLVVKLFLLGVIIIVIFVSLLNFFGKPV
jgi:anaerobic C4-dicarboxylate transporter